MTTVDSSPKTLPMPSVGSWNSTTETHLLFKVYKKVVESSFTPTKNILVFSFSFSFQFIQRIEQYLHSSSWQAALDFVLFFFKINGTIFLKNLLIFTYLPLISLLYTDDSITYLNQKYKTVTVFFSIVMKHAVYRLRHLFI